MNKMWYTFTLMVALTLPAISGSPFNTKIQGFIENNGQWPSEVLFVHRGVNLDAWITRTGIVLDQYTIKGSHRTGHVVRMTWTGASHSPDVELGQQASSVIYNVGKGKNSGLNARSYTSLRFKNTFPGVAVVYYLDEHGRLRYDLDVAAGTPSATISFEFDGDNGLVFDNGEIRLNTSLGGIVMTDLYAYLFGNKHLATPASFRAKSNGVEINLPARNVHEPVTIDPVVYGTYLGGTGPDIITGFALGTSHVYVCGSTCGMSFPQGAGAYSTDVSGGKDGFVAILTNGLNELVKYTYIGGGGTDEVIGIALDQTGNVCIAGNTESTDFPTTIGAVGQIYKGQIDAFICRFSADLEALELSTYLGGNKDDVARGIAVDKSTGSILVCGGTTSNSGFPTTGAHQNAHGGERDGFLSKLSPSGGAFVFSTYYGRAGNEHFTAVALDAAGSPYVTGSTTSSNFETAPTPGRFASGRVPYDRTYNGGLTDAFLIKFFPDGTLSKRDDGTYATFYGGPGEEEGRGIYIDAQGRAVLVGVTNSTVPVTAGTISGEKIGGQDIFVAMFTDDGRGLAAGTYFGGSGSDDVHGIIVDATTNSGYMWGSTNSQNFPVSGEGAITDRLGGSDGFIAQLNPYVLKYSTLIGSYGTDTVIHVMPDANGDIYFAVRGSSEDLPVHDESYQSTVGGDADGYLAKWAFGTLAIIAPSGGEAWCAGTNRTIAWSVAGMPDGQKYDLHVSSDDGETWTSIATGVSGTSYTWRPDAQTTPGTKYRVRISTTRGHLSKSNAFSMGSQPAVTTDPVSTTACEGSSVTLSVTATGTGLSYQWRRNGSPISGARSATYTITPVNASTAGNYDCVVSGDCTPAVTSKQAVVGIAPQTAITAQPTDVTVKVDQPFTLKVTAVGSELRYSWSHNGAEIPGATTNTYSVASAKATDAGDYVVVVSGGCGEATSNTAKVIVEPPSTVKETVVGNGVAVKVLGPIPASETLEILLTTDVEHSVVVSFVSPDGRIVASHDIGTLHAGDQIVTIPVSSLVPGVYGIEVRFGNQPLRTVVNVAK